MAKRNIRCASRKSDDQNHRTSFQVSTQPDLVDDEALDEDQYSLDDDGLLFHTETWSEGTFRRVFTTVYTSSGDERLYADENQNGLQIDNPKFKYELSPDRRSIRLAISTILIDGFTYDTGPVTITAVVRCP